MDKSFRKYLLVDFYALLITLLFLVIKIRPFTAGSGIILTLKQGVVLLPLFVLLLFLGIALFIIFPRRPQLEAQLGSFFNQRRAIGRTLEIACFVVVIAGVILIILDAAGMTRLYGGLYTKALFPSAFLVCIQTILYLGKIYQIGPILEAVRITNRVLYFGVVFAHAIWKFICRNNLAKANVPRIIENCIYTILTLWFFSCLFIDPLNLPFGLKALDFRYGYIEILGYVLLGFLVAFVIPGWLGKLVGLGLVLYFFALPLSGLWESAYNESNILRGLIPLSDANGYFQDANRLLDGQLISFFSAKRPLFTGMLSLLLGLTGRNLQITLVILAAINALTCYIAAREVQRTHGTLAAVLMISISFFFYRRYSGATMTESFGLALGMTGFALLWRGASNHRGVLILSGIFLSSLALLARSGAFFTLPFLVLWSAWFFRKQKRLSLRWMGYATSAVVAAFLINSLILRLVGIPGASSNFNFSYTLYGLVSGGKPWNYVLDEHPELINMVDSDASKIIYNLAFTRFLHDPGLMLQGVIKAGVTFVEPKLGLFSFIRSGYSETGLILTHYLLLFLSAVGILIVLVRRHDEYVMLLSLTGLGIIVSVPFVPPWDTEYMRVYAASVPFIAVMPSVGLMSLVTIIERRIKPLRYLDHPIDLIPPQTSSVMATILVLMTVFGTLGVRFLSHPTVITEQACPAGETTIYIRSNPGSYLIVWDDSQLTQTWVPNVRYGSFIGGHNYDFPFPEILTELAAVKPDSIMIGGYDLKSGSDLTVIGDRRQVSQKNMVLLACGYWGKLAISGRSGFFYATSLKELVVR